VQRFLIAIDTFSMWTGKTIAWVVLLMTFLISYDITMRYLQQPLGDPIARSGSPTRSRTT